MRDLMSAKEVAEYLRVKERKVYDLARHGRIPATRVTGKYLFPKHLIDLWLTQSSDRVGPARPRAALRVAAPPLVVGSHDPLLEWALRESGSGLMPVPGGGFDGIERLGRGDAQLCGLHVLDVDSGSYNVPLLRTVLEGVGVVALEWGWREQGLITAPGNPRGLKQLADLAAKPVTVLARQAGSGGHLLFRHLLESAGIEPAELTFAAEPAWSENELARAIAERKADVGLGIRSAARQYGLEFVPLIRERFDIVMRRRDYFQPPVQALLAFARTDRFRARAEEMGGYDISRLGAVIYNSL